MPAIKPHSTATTDANWDGPAAKANLKNDGDEAYYRSAFAWQDPDGDPKTKAAYKFIHHEVSSDGKVGAANLTACSTGIGVLNGGRGGTVIPDSDRKGVHAHLAKHLTDAGKEAPDLQSALDRQLEPENAGYFRIMSALQNRPWVIQAKDLDDIIRIVEGPVDLEAVAAKIGKPLENGGNRVEFRNGTAILGVEGPLFRYANILTRVSGATSVQQLALDFQSALDDPSVKQILMVLNSPGGQVDGINEFADMIREGNAQKPVTAYVDGNAASGAYWLASAAGKIVANESSFLGSIGVVASITDNRAAQERQGVKVHEIISSQSPLKRTDPATDEGKQQIQQMVDTLAQLFIERVARFRGVSVETVMQKFGRGAMLSARDAIAAGMADGLDSFEKLVGADGSQALTVFSFGAKAQQFDEEELEEDEDENVNDQRTCECPEGEECTCPDDEEDDEDEQEASMERQRIAAILESEEARGRETTAKALAFKTDMDPEAAKKLLAELPKETTEKPAKLEERMRQVPNPTVGVEGDAHEDSTATEVQRILAFVPKDRLVAARR